MADSHKNPSRTRVPLYTAWFRNQGGAHILVNAKIAGQKIMLIVDTGCTNSMLVSAFAQYGKPIINDKKRERIYSVSGKVNNYSTVMIDSLSIGRLHLPPTAVTIIDIPEVQTLYKKGFKMQIDGLLGCDILNRCKATISFSQHSLTLYDPFQATLPDDL